MSTDTLAARLDLMQMQVRWLEQEIELLRKQIARDAPPAKPARTFAELEGLWEGIVINQEDFEEARLKMPNDI